ncbi:hypothetical protein FACS1894171_0990 [Clostridia bacterium]|nr:hypothetical protein FACS1894171_0990 [Clostridia bacterium]
MGYEKLYLDLKPRLTGCDFDESAERLGLKRIEGGVSVTLLGREFHVTAEGAEPADGLESGPNSRSVLVHYVTGGGWGKPGDDFLPLFSLTGMIEGQNAQNRSLMTEPLTREFGGDVEKLKKAAARIGGEYLGPNSSGAHIWQFEALPKIPIRLEFYEADDEFPAEAQILFESSAGKFMEFECLAFLAGCMSSGLTGDRSDHP